MAKKKAGGNSGPSRPKKKGKGGFKTIIIAAVITIAVGIVLIAVYGDRFPKSLGPERPHAIKPRPVPPPVIVKPSGPDAMEIRLYFSDEDGLYLRAESRLIKKTGLEAEVREALTQLLSGPASKRLESAIPKGTRLRDVKVRGRVAFVDLSRELVDRHPGGSSAEIQTVYAIVNTITLNFHEIKSVQILVNGKTEDTLAGHIDISTPIPPDKKVIKG